MKSDNPGLSMFEFQNVDFITTSVDAIVILDKFYEPLVPTRNVKCWYIYVEQTNNGGTVEDIEVELTVNGVVNLETIAAAASGALFNIHFDTGGILRSATPPRSLLSVDPDQAVPLETQSLRARVRQTTAVDLVSATIEFNIIYAIKVMSA